MNQLRSLLATGLLSSLLATSALAASRTFKVGAGSKVNFDAASSLHGFSGGTEAVTGEVRWDPTEPLSATGEVEIEVMQLRTGNGKRDRGMRHEALDAKQWPRIKMTMKRFVVDPRESTDRKLVGNIHGTLFLHGQEQKIVVPAEVETTGPKTLHVSGKVGIDMTSWGITPPVNRVLFVTIRVLPNVTVGFELDLETTEELSPLTAAAPQGVDGSRIGKIRQLVDRIRDEPETSAVATVPAGR